MKHGAIGGKLLGAGGGGCFLFMIEPENRPLFLGDLHQYGLITIPFAFEMGGSTVLLETAQ